MPSCRPQAQGFAYWLLGRARREARDLLRRLSVREQVCGSTCLIDRRNDKGLPKKAFRSQLVRWLPDLDSNQGPAD